MTLVRSLLHISALVKTYRWSCFAGDFKVLLTEFIPALLYISKIPDPEKCTDYTVLLPDKHSSWLPHTKPDSSSTTK